MKKSQPYNINNNSLREVFNATINANYYKLLLIIIIRVQSSLYLIGGLMILPYLACLTELESDTGFGC